MGITLIAGHAPRERVSWNAFVMIWNLLLAVTLHVSVWVEIVLYIVKRLTTCHAPRERVSWNTKLVYKIWEHFVTLHVSVWVEIWTSSRPSKTYTVTLHVSVWVEILRSVGSRVARPVTLHVSVWVEMDYAAMRLERAESRSTWACELKSAKVSKGITAAASRSTWACELK